MPNYLDIFAGAGGLSEGFIRAGYTPVAHIEMDKAACYTLKTRLSYKWLSDHGEGKTYLRYLRKEISRQDLYAAVPSALLDTVLNYEISRENLNDIFQKIDQFLDGERLDLIVGGPPCQAYWGEHAMRTEWLEILEITCTSYMLNFYGAIIPDILFLRML